MKTRNKVIATVIAGLLSSTAALAATDGSLGATSTGQIDLDLEVLKSTQITALDDINFGQYGGANSGDLNQGDAYCVYVSGGEDYTITPTSTNGDFKLIGATNSDEIGYTVKLAGAATGAASQAAVTYNTASATFTGDDATDCGAANNASIDVSITEAAIRAVSADDYSDTLVLLVNPI